MIFWTIVAVIAALFLIAWWWSHEPENDTVDRANNVDDHDRS